MSNPSVTFRLLPEDRDRLDALAVRTGKSLGQLLRENLGLAERDEEATYSVGWNDGFGHGLEEGREEGRKSAFGSVALPCMHCGKVFVVNFYQDRNAASVLLEAFSKWGHKECLRRTGFIA